CHQDDAACRLAVEEFAKNGDRPLLLVLHVVSVASPTRRAGPTSPDAMMRKHQWQGQVSTAPRNLWGAQSTL
ncbi:hypothetical protein, partial [Mesorhizobium sp.]|uniref:hypothetical protein n=1 Tax=Mesorhizobium sp. TaxID=1871066 RepID=UPI00258EBAE3